MNLYNLNKINKNMYLQKHTKCQKNIKKTEYTEYTEEKECMGTHSLVSRSRLFSRPNFDNAFNRISNLQQHEQQLYKL